MNPRQQVLQEAIKNFLLASVKYRQLVYAGHHFGGSGAWVLQDDSFSVESLAWLCKDQEIDQSLKQQENGKFVIVTNSEGQWKTSAFSKMEMSKSLTVEVNPAVQVTII